MKAVLISPNITLTRTPVTFHVNVHLKLDKVWLDSKLLHSFDSFMLNVKTVE